MGLTALHSEWDPELSGPSSLHHLSKTSNFRRARNEAGTAQKNSQKHPTASPTDFSGDATISNRRPPVVARSPATSLTENSGPSPQLTGPLFQSDGQASGYSHTAAPNMGNPDWTMQSMGMASMEDYTQIAEDMSFYLTQSGQELSTWWDMNMLPSTPS